MAFHFLHVGLVYYFKVGENPHLCEVLLPLDFSELLVSLLHYARHFLGSEIVLEIALFNAKVKFSCLLDRNYLLREHIEINDFVVLHFIV